MKVTTSLPYQTSLGRAAIVRQLQAVEQQIAHMAQLVEEDDECLAMVREGLAAKRALSVVGRALLDDCLVACAASAVACLDPDCRERQSARLPELNQALIRLSCPACRRPSMDPSSGSTVIAANEG